MQDARKKEEGDGLLGMNSKSATSLESFHYLAIAERVQYSTLRSYRPNVLGYDRKTGTTIMTLQAFNNVVEDIFTTPSIKPIYPVMPRSRRMPVKECERSSEGE